MKKLKLLKIILCHFKCFGSQTFEINGGNVSILGDNGTGKTTLLDAFLWGLFGYDSAGRYDFELKTLGSDGKVVPMLEHSVELVLECNGQRITIKKTLSELWVKARGRAVSEFSGHKTTYAIDGVPMQKKEFDAAIARLCDEGLLRIVTDPGYFPAKLPWQERRQLVSALCDEPSAAEVLAENATLAELDTVLAGRSIEAHRKVIAARKAVINNELKAIPVRVDEAARAMPRTSEMDRGKLQGEWDAVRNELDEVEMKLRVTMQSAGSDEAGQRLRLEDNQRHLETLQRNRKETEDEIARLSAENDRLDVQLAQKRAEWNRVDAETFAASLADTCPTCGQTMPEQARQGALDAAQDRFGADKENRLLAISAAGKTLAAHAKQLQQRKQKLSETRGTLQAEGEELAKIIKELSQQLLPADRTPAVSAVDTLTVRREELRQMDAELATVAASFELRQAGEQRIAELKAKEQTLADEYAELDRQTFLTEEYIRTKVRLLESKINSRFKVARFRLFEQQVNGALNEVCEVLGSDLVPYNSGLNNAARINTGIDIINTLSEHYGFSAPIFVDNAEAVTQLIDTPAQVIRLVVSEGEKTLKVQQDGENDNGNDNGRNDKNGETRIEKNAEKPSEKVAEKRVRRPRQVRVTDVGAVAETTTAATPVLSGSTGPGF